MLYKVLSLITRDNGIDDIDPEQFFCNETQTFIYDDSKLPSTYNLENLTSSEKVHQTILEFLKKKELKVLKLLTNRNANSSISGYISDYYLSKFVEKIILSHKELVTLEYTGLIFGDYEANITRVLQALDKGERIKNLIIYDSTVIPKEIVPLLIKKLKSFQFKFRGYLPEYLIQALEESQLEHLSIENTLSISDEIEGLARVIEQNSNLKKLQLKGIKLDKALLKNIKSSSTLLNISIDFSECSVDDSELLEILGELNSDKFIQKIGKNKKLISFDGDRLQHQVFRLQKEIYEQIKYNYSIIYMTGINRRIIQSICKRNVTQSEIEGLYYNDTTRFGEYDLFFNYLNNHVSSNKQKDKNITPSMLLSLITSDNDIDPEQFFCDETQTFIYDDSKISSTYNLENLTSSDKVHQTILEFLEKKELKALKLLTNRKINDWFSESTSGYYLSKFVEKIILSHKELVTLEYTGLFFDIFEANNTRVLQALNKSERIKNLIIYNPIVTPEEIIPLLKKIKSFQLKNFCYFPEYLHKALEESQLEHLSIESNYSFLWEIDGLARVIEQNSNIKKLQLKGIKLDKALLKNIKSSSTLLNISIDFSECSVDDSELLEILGELNSDKFIQKIGKNKKLISFDGDRLQHQVFRLQKEIYEQIKYNYSIIYMTGINRRIIQSICKRNVTQSEIEGLYYNDTTRFGEYDLFFNYLNNHVSSNKQKDKNITLFNEVAKKLKNLGVFSVNKQNNNDNNGTLKLKLL